LFSTQKNQNNCNTINENNDTTFENGLETNTNNLNTGISEQENLNKSCSTRVKSEDKLQNFYKKEKEIKANLEFVDSLGENEYGIIINIFTDSLKLLMGKILSFDMEKLFKWTKNIMTLIFSISNTSNNLLKILKCTSTISKIFVEKKLSEEIIEILSLLNEKGFFSNFDILYGKIDEFSLNIKSTVFRCLYSCVILIKAIRENDKNSIVFIIVFFFLLTFLTYHDFIIKSNKGI